MSIFQAKPENEDKFTELKRMSHEKRLEAIRLDEEAKRAWQASYAYQNEAAALVAPFKVGDIIEYTTHQGYAPRLKTVTLRMKVSSMNVEAYSTGVIRLLASGRQYTKDMQPGRVYRLSASFGTGSIDTFVKVLKSA